MTKTESTPTISPMALLGDKVLMFGIGLSALTNVVLELQFVESVLAIGATVILLMIAALAYGEISSAGAEQARSVSQVSETFTQMDQATPQNAALVKQMVAAAGSLKSQALDLVQNVDVFENSQPRPTTGFQSVGAGSAGQKSSSHILTCKP